MTSIRDTMELHHKHCDEEFAAAEEAVQRGDWGIAATAFANFAGDLEAHFSAEETVLFPAYENRTGMSEGPTEVMRTEHAQMRGLLQQMEQGLKARDSDAFAGSAETLLILMQQHNMKEEHILYPMCDQALGAEADLIARLEGALHFLAA
jgi:hemerythrin-like domain-containing protein